MTYYIWVHIKKKYHLSKQRGKKRYFVINLFEILKKISCLLKSLFFNQKKKKSLSQVVSCLENRLSVDFLYFYPTEKGMILLQKWHTKAIAAKHWYLKDENKHTYIWPVKILSMYWKSIFKSYSRFAFVHITWLL